MKKTTCFLFILLLMLATTASDCNEPEGFTIMTEFGLYFNGFPRIVTHPNVVVFGVWESDEPGATGTRTQLPFNAHTNNDALYPVPDGRVPAKWRIGEFSGPCTNLEKVFPIKRGETLRVLCDTTCVFIPCEFPKLPFSAVPDYVDGTNPPATITINGFGIDSTYGMPYVQYYDPTGTLVAQTQASSVALDGSWLSGPTP